MARPLDELQRDAIKALEAGKDSMSITETELVMLKQYELVLGTGVNRVVRTLPKFGCEIDLWIREDDRQ